MAATDSVVLLRRRAACEQSIRQRHQETQDSRATDSLSYAALNARQIQLAEDYKLFKEHHSQLVGTIDDDTEQEHYERREEVDRLYFEAQARLVEQIEQKRPAPAAVNGNLSTNQTIRVETARAPEPGEFNGNPCDWPAFRDRFRAEVHNKDFDEVTKLLYLQKACVGSAKSTLGHWQPIAINYAKAWESLEQKFDDPYRLEQALTTEIMRIPRALEETHMSLRKIIDVTANTVRQLEAMGVPVDQWDSILINIIVDRLPRATTDAWEQRRNVNKKPTLRELLAFLEAKARGRIYTESQTTCTLPYDQFNTRYRPYEQFGGRSHHHEHTRGRCYINHNNYSSRNGSNVDGEQRNHSNDGHDRRFNIKQKFVPTKPAVEQSGQPSGGVRCYQCNQSHPVYRCKEFLNKTVEVRAANVKEWNVCANCLRVHAGKCSFNGCHRCGNEMHNSVLCPKKERSLR